MDEEYQGVADDNAGDDVFPRPFIIGDLVRQLRAEFDEDDNGEPAFGIGNLVQQLRRQQAERDAEARAALNADEPPAFALGPLLARLREEREEFNLERFLDEVGDYENFHAAIDRAGGIGAMLDQLAEGEEVQDQLERFERVWADDAEADRQIDYFLRLLNEEPAPIAVSDLQAQPGGSPLVPSPLFDFPEEEDIPPYSPPPPPSPPTSSGGAVHSRRWTVFFLTVNTNRSYPTDSSAANDLRIMQRILNRHAWGTVQKIESWLRYTPHYAMPNNDNTIAISLRRPTIERGQERGFVHAHAIISVYHQGRTRRGQRDGLDLAETGRALQALIRQPLSDANLSRNPYVHLVLLDTSRTNNYNIKHAHGPADRHGPAWDNRW